MRRGPVHCDASIALSGDAPNEHPMSGSSSPSRRRTVLEVVALYVLLTACGVSSPLATQQPGSEGATDSQGNTQEQDAAASRAPDAAADDPKGTDEGSSGNADSPDAGTRTAAPPCGAGPGCDPSNFGGETCESLGLGEGQLLCDPTSCTIIVALCKGLGTDTPRLGPPCGSGPGCDPADLGDETCGTLGLGEGTLSCDPVTCMFDTSMCTSPGGGGSGGSGGTGG